MNNDVFFVIFEIAILIILTIIVLQTGKMQVNNIAYYAYCELRDSFLDLEYTYKYIGTFISTNSELQDFEILGMNYDKYQDLVIDKFEKEIENVWIAKLTGNLKRYNIPCGKKYLNEVINHYSVLLFDNINFSKHIVTYLSTTIVDKDDLCTLDYFRSIDGTDYNSSFDDVVYEENTAFIPDVDDEIEDL